MGLRLCIADLLLESLTDDGRAPVGVVEFDDRLEAREGYVGRTSREQQLKVLRGEGGRGEKEGGRMGVIINTERHSRFLLHTSTLYSTTSLIPPPPPPPPPPQILSRNHGEISGGGGGGGVTVPGSLPAKHENLRRNEVTCLRRQSCQQLCRDDVGQTLFHGL